MKHKAVAIIPARGGSKRIPRKNIVELGGLPLLAHSIISAKKSKYLNDLIFVSTEDAKIAKVAKKFGGKIIDRPASLATDGATTLSVLQHSVKALDAQELDFDTVVLLQATCPFRRTATIDRSIKKIWDNWNKYKVIFSIQPSKFPPNWLFKVKGDKLQAILPNDFSKIRSQETFQTYQIDGVVYVYKKDFLIKSKKYAYSADMSGYIKTTKTESIDIDNMEDLKLARKLI